MIPFTPPILKAVKQLLRLERSVLYMGIQPLLHLPDHMENRLTGIVGVALKLPAFVANAISLKNRFGLKSVCGRVPEKNQR